MGLSDMTCFAKADKAITLIRLNAERFCLAVRICTMILSGLVNAVLSQWAALAKVLFDNALTCIDLIKNIDQLEDKIQALSHA
ncbi:MAG: hypothetical protein HUN05_04280 [Desulfobacter sp.]|nr:MAG: hypothetical protein HUN05_04280 [Desulfobacter sp.]